MALDFELLKTNKGSLWLAELAALLHNIGKMHSYWINKGRKKQGNPQDISESFRFELIGGVAGTYFDNQNQLDEFEKLLSRLTKKQDVNLAGPINRTDKLKRRVHSARTVMSSYRHLESLFKSPVQLPVPFTDREYLVGDILDFQDSGWYNYPNETDRSWFTLFTGEQTSELTRLFQICHQQASGGEKRSVEKELFETQSGKKADEKKSDSPEADLSTVFGFPKKPGTSLDALAEVNKRFTLLNPKDLQNRDAICRFLHVVMVDGLADPHLPINDVRVSDMGFAAAAFFKAGIAGSLLQGHIPQKLEWQLVRFCIDGDRYLEKANTISDLVGREKALHEYIERLRQALESEWFLGNQVYFDSCGPVFLFPALDEDDDRQELRQAIERWALEAVKETTAGAEVPFGIASSHPFALGPGSGYSFALGELLDEPVPPLCASSAALKLWSSPNLEVCTSCGIRPIPLRSAGSDRQRVARLRRICSNCLDMRVGRTAEWSKELSEGAKQKQTIWLDELADRHGRVALISARLRLRPWLTRDNYIHRTLLVFDEKSKNGERRKSPSFARLARILDTASDFWDGATEEFSRNHKATSRLCLKGRLESGGGVNLMRNLAYILETKEGIKINVVCHQSNPLHLVVVENLQRLRDQAKTQDLHILLSQGGRISEPTGYGSPDREIGSVYIETVDEIGGEYIPRLRVFEQPDRLWMLCPADAALDFASSLYARYAAEMSKVRSRLALDVGIAYFSGTNPVRVALDAARRFSRARFEATPWELADNPSFENSDGKDGGKLSLKFEGGLTWEGVEADTFYTYFEAAPDNKRTFVSNLLKESSVLVEPSHFDFVYLDQAAERFEVAYREHPGNTHYLRRAHGHRPHPLERIPDLNAAWGLLSRLPGSQLKSLAERLQGAAEDWRYDQGEVYEWFAKTLLEEAGWPENAKPSAQEVLKLVQWARNGVLEDVIEIKLGIEKES